MTYRRHARALSSRVCEPRRLGAADIAALADAVATRLSGPVSGGLLDTRQVAAHVGVSTDWVRDHAAELGAVRIGDGPRGELRFELDRVLAALDRRRLAFTPPAPPRRRPGPAPSPRGDVELIPLPDWVS
jgi:hypothetical protein